MSIEQTAEITEDFIVLIHDRNERGEIEGAFIESGFSTYKEAEDFCLNSDPPLKIVERSWVSYFVSK